MKHVVGKQYGSTCTEGLVIEIVNKIKNYGLSGKVISGGTPFRNEIGNIRDDWAPDCFTIEVPINQKQVKSLLTPTLK